MLGSATLTMVASRSCMKTAARLVARPSHGPTDRVRSVKCVTLSHRHPDRLAARTSQKAVRLFKDCWMLREELAAWNPFARHLTGPGPTCNQSHTSLPLAVRHWVPHPVARSPCHTRPTSQLEFDTRSRSMDLNLITHWKPEPGRVVEWKVTDASARAAAGAPVDPALRPPCRNGICDRWIC